MSNLSIRFHIHLFADPRDTLMSATFEALADQLQLFDRMHFEMDGSFVWTGNTPAAWQLDGMVYDLNQRIQRIELKGQCPRANWQQLLIAMNFPTQPLIAHDLQAAQFVTIQQLESQLWNS